MAAHARAPPSLLVCGLPTREMDENTEAIIETVNRFLWSDMMQESLNSFCENHAEMFVGVREDAGVEGEQKLEWTQAHIDFQELFEFQLENFLASQPFSTEDFVAACQDALDHGGWEGCGRGKLLQLSAHATELDRAACAVQLSQTARHRRTGRAVDVRVRLLREHDGGGGGRTGAGGGGDGSDGRRERRGGRAPGRVSDRPVSGSAVQFSSGMAGARLVPWLRVDAKV